jgi:signal transduction histidine kinase
MKYLCAIVDRGVGAILLAEEALNPESIGCLTAALGRSPPWSDVPIAIITSGGEVSQTRLRRLSGWMESGNVILLERPFRPETLVSTFEVALRSRQRQYQVRDLLAERSRREKTLRESDTLLRRAQALLTDKASLLEKTVQERTAKLQETIGELEHFSHTITHDMRAPLRAMHGFGIMLRSESAGQLTPKGDDYVARIMEGSRRMDALIRDALQYTKILSGEVKLTGVDPGPLLRGIVDSYPTLAPPQAYVEIEEPLPPVIANEAGLLQCFSNLLTNAAKFVEPGKTPRVRVWAENRAGMARFWFEDNGIGIAPEYQERIFGMFQQLEKSYEGTGIGLALVRKAATRMGGQVGLDSTLGKGSRFWLEFRRAGE